MFFFSHCSFVCIIMSYCYIITPASDCTPQMRLIADGNYAMHIVIWNQAKPTSNLPDCWQSSKQFGWVSQTNKWLLVWASIIACCRYWETEYARLNVHIYGLMWKRCNSSALAMELHPFSIKPSMGDGIYVHFRLKCCPCPIIWIQYLLPNLCWFLNCWELLCYQIPDIISISICPHSLSQTFFIPPAQRSCWGGILVSLRLSVRPSVRPSRMLCPLCNIYSYEWILFILGTNDHYHERVCRTPWPLTLTYIIKVIWPWLRKSCPLCSAYSSGWILFYIWHKWSLSLEDVSRVTFFQNLEISIFETFSALTMKKNLQFSMDSFHI